MIDSIILWSTVVSRAGAAGRENFLSAGPGSAGVSLGGALVSRGVDSSAGFYNPATLIGQPSGAMFEYAQPNQSATRSWLAFAVGESRAKMGLLWKNETLPLSSWKNAFLMSTGVSDKLIPFVPRGFSMGMTLGYVQEKISNYSATAYLASLGSAYNGQAGRTKYSLGLMLHNLYFSGLQFRPDGEKEVWPARAELGASLSRWGITLLSSVLTGDGTSSAFGVSYQPVPYAELRAGMDGGPRIGMGFEVKKFRVDYALSLSVLSQAHSMTLSYLWGKQEEEKDYTNPLTELSARYEALSPSVLAEIKMKAQGGDIPTVRDVLKLLAVDLNSQDGWSFYCSLSGKHRFGMRLPFSKKVRREYMEFAVTFVNDGEKTEELATMFVTRHPKESVSDLVREVIRVSFTEEVPVAPAIEGQQFPEMGPFPKDHYR